MEIAEVKKEVVKILKEELKDKNYQAFFFGSRISGTANDRSDLDVGIEGKEPLSLEILSSIRTRCEAIRTLYTIDIVDFGGVSNEFKEVAKEHIEDINL